MAETSRVRWRMTLDELAAACDVDATELNVYAASGGLGSRFMEHRLSGKWRHITRDVAQRAVLMSRLRAAGVQLGAAAAITKSYEAKNSGQDITMSTALGVSITVSTDDLP